MNEKIPELWRGSEKNIGVCALCGDEEMKKYMFSIFIKRPRGTPKVTAHYCERCFAKVCDQLGLGEF